MGYLSQIGAANIYTPNMNPKFLLALWEGLQVHLTQSPFKIAISERGLVSVWPLNLESLFPKASGSHQS